MSDTTALTPDERQGRILALLEEQRRLPVADLARLFATSEDSIRRDLRALAAAGRIRRVHGAVLPAAVPLAAFAARGGEQAGAKAAIAEVAARLVPADATVLVDGGTTVMAVIRALPPDRRLTVVTTSVPVADALAVHPLATVVLVGGTLDKASRTTVGPTAVDAVRAVRADLCLLGLCSLDAEAGVTATGYEESLVKRAMIAASGGVLAVATADKLGRAAPFAVAEAGAVTRLVTTADAPAAALGALADIGVDVVVA
jgi:DeoR/GlpR family transcriptional regulator of sugar metabolism